MQFSPAAPRTVAVAARTAAGCTAAVAACTAAPRTATVAVRTAPVAAHTEAVYVYDLVGAQAWAYVFVCVCVCVYVAGRVTYYSIDVGKEMFHYSRRVRYYNILYIYINY